MNLEKLAEMTPEERAAVIKYLKAGLGAGVLASGIGLAASRAKSIKDRQSKSPEKSRNAIIVDINKDNFLKDLPTPAAQAEMVGKRAMPAIVGGSDDKPQMTEEEIAAAKKEILRRGRKMDFFGIQKAAEPKTEVRQVVEKPVGEDKGNADSDKKDDSKPTPPRDAEGRFVSPTSPIAAFQSEKDAAFKFDFSKWLMHPWDSTVDAAKDVGERMWNSAKVHPLGIAAGGLGAIYLSAMIVDKVNEMRAKASKRSANESRKEYIRLLQGGSPDDGAEKSAQDGKPGVPEWTGATVGAAVVLPFIVSHMITNKIMENRKEKEKKLKSMANSYPEDPIILYKTSEEKEIKLNPDAAFAMIMLKQAMVDAAGGFEKSADVLGALKTMFPGAAKAIGNVVDGASDKMYGSAADSIAKAVADKNNSGLVLDLAKAYQSGNVTDMNSHMMSLIGKVDPKMIPATGAASALNPKKLMRRVAGHQGIQDALAGYISDDSNAAWKAWRDDMISKKLGRYFRKGSPIYNITQWMANNLGIGKFLARNAIQNKLMAMSGKNKVQNPK